MEKAGFPPPPLPLLLLLRLCSPLIKYVNGSWSILDLLDRYQLPASRIAGLVSFYLAFVIYFLLGFGPRRKMENKETFCFKNIKL